MSQAERHAKQAEQAAERAAAYLRQRQALGVSQITLAVHVVYQASAAPWNWSEVAHWVIDAYRQAHSKKTHDGIVQRREFA